MRFELYVAARYLKAKRRQAVVGVVTAISIAGVAAGVAALIIALAITNGMRRDLQDRLVDSSAHVQLMRVKNDGIRDWRPLVEKLSRLPHVVAAAPELDEQVMVARGARAGYALIEGVVPGQEQRRQQRPAPMLPPPPCALSIQRLHLLTPQTPNCRLSSSAKSWQIQSAQTSATPSCWSALKAI